MFTRLSNADDDEWVTLVGRYILNMGALEMATRLIIARIAYSAEDDRLFRRNVTGYSAESALAGFSTLAGHDQSRFRGVRWS
jgi:hypothetical protein